MLAKKPKKCARRMTEAIERFRDSTMPAEQDVRRRLISLCAMCGKCRISPADIIASPQ